MITGHDLYNVLSAVVPLYVAMILAYGSVRWWGILTPEQCGGINRFVAIFAVPLLSFEIVSSNDPYSMNLRFILADGLQKLVVLVVLAAWHRWWSRSINLDWLITLFMLATLPNTLVMGVPLLAAMYGTRPGSLVVQAVVLQCVAWYTLLLLLYEYRAATSLIRQRFPGGAAAAIVSLRVESDVVSLDGREQPIQADAELRDDGKLHVTVRRSFSAAPAAVPVATPRPSDLTGADIYSLHSSRNPTPRHSNFHQHWPPASMLASSRSPARPSIADVYPYVYSPTPRFSNDAWTGVHQSPSTKDLQMFIWSASASPTSEAYRISTGGPGPRYLQELEEYSYDQEAEAHQAQPSLTKSSSTTGLVKTPAETASTLPPARVMTKLILSMVWRKLLRNPNTYSSLVGVTWALVSFKWHLELPAIVDKSITILSSAGLGMAMFSLGLFMALQKRLLACGTSLTLYGMLVRFVTGPAVMAASSLAVGLRGVDLKVSIVQAALPQGIVPFVFAKEYDLHPDVLSTAVIFGMLIAFPITLLYYVLLGL